MNNPAASSKVLNPCYAINQKDKDHKSKNAKQLSPVRKFTQVHREKLSTH